MGVSSPPRLTVSFATIMYYHATFLPIEALSYDTNNGRKGLLDGREYQEKSFHL